MAKQLKKIYINDIAKMTQAMLERASKKHKSIISYCIFIEGDHWHALTPKYESEREEKYAMQRLMSILVHNPELCKSFAQFVVPPARYHEREAKKARKNLSSIASV